MKDAGLRPRPFWSGSEAAPWGGRWIVLAIAAFGVTLSGCGPSGPCKAPARPYACGYIVNMKTHRVKPGVCCPVPGVSATGG